MPQAATTNANDFTHSIKHKIQRELTHSTAFLGHITSAPAAKHTRSTCTCFNRWTCSCLHGSAWKGTEQPELQSCQCHLQHRGGQLRNAATNTRLPPAMPSNSAINKTARQSLWRALSTPSVHALNRQVRQDMERERLFLLHNRTDL